MGRRRDLFPTIHRWNKPKADGHLIISLPPSTSATRQVAVSIFFLGWGREGETTDRLFAWLGVGEEGGEWHPFLSSPVILYPQCNTSSMTAACLSPFPCISHHHHHFPSVCTHFLYRSKKNVPSTPTCRSSLTSYYIPL